MEKRSLNGIITLLLSCVFLFDYSVQAQMSKRRSSKINVEKFVVEPFMDAISNDSLKIVTFIEIPYSSVQFIKNGEAFLAKYQASLGIKNNDGDEVDYMVWTDSIRLNSYKDTRSALKNRKHYTTFRVKVNKGYSITGQLQDLDTRKTGTIKKKIILDGMDNPPKLIKPNFLLDLSGNWGFANGKIPNKGFRVREIGAGVDLNISGLVNKDKYQVNIYITNNLVSDSLIQKFTGDGLLGYFSETIFIPSTKFMALKNDFRVELIQGKDEDEVEFSFTKYKTGSSNFIRNTDSAIKQMKYILTNNERKELKEADKGKKEDLLYSFWKERDPTPDTEFNELMEEYYERVDYVNEHFSSWQPGWETDMGMVYIMFGPPDEIRRTNPSMSNSSIYIIWSYFSINKEFIFRDQNGFGDFRLDNPSIGLGL